MPCVQADEEDASDEWIGSESGCARSLAVKSGDLKETPKIVRGGNSSDRGSLGKPSDNSASLGIPSVVIEFIPVSNIFEVFVGTEGGIITVSNIFEVLIGTEGHSEFSTM